MVMNKKHSHGIEYQPDSLIYDGSFQQDQKHCTASITDSLGDRYEGKWLENMAHGHGKNLPEMEKFMKVASVRVRSLEKVK